LGIIFKNEPTNQPTNQLANQSINQPNNQLTNQLTKQLANQSTNQQIIHLNLVEGDVSFLANEAKNWFNPEYWKEVDSDGNPVEYQSNELLHLNQIPCQHDQVQFTQVRAPVGTIDPIDE